MSADLYCAVVDNLKINRCRTHSRHSSPDLLCKPVKKPHVKSENWTSIFEEWDWHAGGRHLGWKHCTGFWTKFLGFLLFSTPTGFTSEAYLWQVYMAHCGPICSRIYHINLLEKGKILKRFFDKNLFWFWTLKFSCRQDLTCKKWYTYPFIYCYSLIQVCTKYSWMFLLNIITSMQT